MVYCCVPYCTSKSGKSKGISFHDFPLDSSLQQKWLIVIRRANFTPNTESFTDAVCSLHFLTSDYKPGLKRRCLKPHAIPSVFPYPSYQSPKIKSPRKIPVRKSASNKKKTPLASKVQSFDSSASIENECLDNEPLSSSTSQNLLTDSFSQTTWNIDEELMKLKRQNLAFRAKIRRANEKVCKLQSRLDSALEKLNRYEDSAKYLAYTIN